MEAWSSPLTHTSALEIAVEGLVNSRQTFKVQFISCKGGHVKRAGWHELPVPNCPSEVHFFLWVAMAKAGRGASQLEWFALVAQRQSPAESGSLLIPFSSLS